MTEGKPSPDSIDSARKILREWRGLHTERPQPVRYTQDRHDQLNLALEQTLAFALHLHRRLAAIEEQRNER